MKINIFVIFMTILICLFYYIYTNFNYESINIDEYKFLHSSSFTTNEFSKDVIDDDDDTFDLNPSINTCILPDLDPWDKKILPYLRQNFNKLKNCKIKFDIITKLDKYGKLSIDSTEKNKNITCYYRCLLPLNDYNLKYSLWLQITNNTYPKCDIIEVNCKNNNIEFYNYLHKQIYQLNITEISNNKTNTTENDTMNKPDVHIILFDSVSHSQFIRSMPKTRYILEDIYQAIPYRYLNKIGLNSRPNGFALLFGKSIYNIKKSPISSGHPSDYPNNSYCRKYLDDDQFIGYRFQDDGYVTMMSEDWALGVFNWPNCYGFKKQPTTHYMRPFQLRVEGNRYKSSTISRNLHKRTCKEAFHHQIEYLKDFLEKYPNKPKYSLTWMSYLAHDNPNSLFHTDEYFYQFFQNNYDKFNNSYLIVMGDHGNRFSPYRKYQVGEYEDNNPFLFIITPDSLRNTKTTHQIRKNSNQLITHYDLYSTLNDIVKPSKPRIKNPLIRGSSLLKPLPENRSCDELFIPFHYCLCVKQEISLPKNNEISIKGAKLMVEKMNFELKNDLETEDLCLSLQLDDSNDVSITEIIQKTSSKYRVYKIQFVTIPGKGHFWGHISEDVKTNELTVLTEKMPRMDAYASQAQCVAQSTLASYCYCKDNDNSNNQSNNQNSTLDDT